MDDLNDRVNASINSLVDSVDGVLRPSVAAAYRCAAACFEGPGTAAEAGKCGAACQRQVQAVQEAFSAELQAFQERLARCEADAQDKLVQSFPAGAAPPQPTPELNARFAALLRPCVEEHVARLPAIRDRMEKLAKSTPAAPPAAKSGWLK